jgi:hypothetical protein
VKTHPTGVEMPRGATESQRRPGLIPKVRLKADTTLLVRLKADTTLLVRLQAGPPCALHVR